MQKSSLIFSRVFVRLIILFIGLIIIVPAANTLFTYGKYRYLGIEAWGIIDHPSSSRDFGGRPLIQYRDGDQKLHEFKSKAKTHWFKTPKKGERINIFIHRDEPGRAIVNNLFHYVLLPLVFLFAGGYCCLYSFTGQRG